MSYLKIQIPEVLEKNEELLNYIEMISSIQNAYSYSELVERSASGDKEARRNLICHYLKAVVKIAIRNYEDGMSIMDLIQEGNKIVTETVHRQDLYVKDCYNTYVLSILAYKMEDYKNMQFKQNDVDFVDFQRASIDSHFSLEEEMIKKNFIYDILCLFQICNLSEKEVYVLCMRYGLFCERKYKLREIALIFDVSYQAIEDIERVALNKMKLYPYLLKFCSYTPQSINCLEAIQKCQKKQKLCGNWFRNSVSIYSYFREYSKTEIYDILNQLSEVEKVHLLSFYEDLENGFRKFDFDCYPKMLFSKIHWLLIKNRYQKMGIPEYFDEFVIFKTLKL